MERELVGAQLKERESEADPPAPLTIDQYEKARKELAKINPEAELYLTMLWMFAARPADITRLRVRSIAFSEPDANRNIPTQITIREGKGQVPRSIPGGQRSSHSRQRCFSTFAGQAGIPAYFQECSRGPRANASSGAQVCPDATLQSPPERCTWPTGCQRTN
eukprot:gene6394-biopygen4065